MQYLVTMQIDGMDVPPQTRSFKTYAMGQKPPVLFTTSNIWHARTPLRLRPMCRWAEALSILRASDLLGRLKTVCPIAGEET